MKCPNCGGSNPEYRRVCEYCGTFLKRPPLTLEEEKLRDQLLSMSLGVEDLSTICFSLGIYWHELEGEPDEATRVEMLVRMLADDGRLDEVSHFLRDFRFPQGFAPLPGPYPDNMWLTYVFACQNVASMAQLQESARELANGSDAVVTALGAVLDMTTELRQSSGGLETEIEKIAGSMETLSDVSTDSKNGMMEMSVGIREIFAMIESVSDAGTQTDERVQKLESLVARFKTEG